MTVSLSIGIGMVLSFAFTELTGLAGGGLVVPGYLALYMDQPVRIIATLGIALITYLVVLALSNVVVLYGRRRFMASILTAFWLGWFATRAGARLNVGGVELRAIGYIVPGLIANDMYRQGFVKTLGCVVLLSALARLVLMVVS